MLTTYEYDDMGRVTRSYTASAWTEEDRALMLAWKAYEDGFCPGCGQPKDKAWHPDNEGWFEVTQTFECHPCTAMRREADPAAEPVRYLAVTDTRDYEQNPLPPMPTGSRLTPEELAAAMGGAA